MTRNERKAKATAKRALLVKAVSSAFAEEAAREAARKAREEYLASYPAETSQFSVIQRGLADRRGGLQVNGGKRKFVTKTAPPVVTRPKLEGEALAKALADGTIGEKRKRLIR